MRDLSDSLERETDLKDQLKFAEEEIRIMRKKLCDMDEENESLNLQVRHNPYNAEICLYKLWRPKGFFNLKSL